MRLWAVLPLLLWSALAQADARQDQEARAAYSVGKAAYESGDYQLAYDKFVQSFQLSHEPALLYNIASALQGLKRPHDAAEALRSFLRLQPNDPDRPRIEQRIATLEVEQRMVDSERAKAEEAAAAERRAKEAELTPPPAPPPQTQTIIVHEGPTEAERKHKRKVLAIALTVSGVVLVGGTVALVLALTQTKTAPFSMGDIGPLPATK